MGLDRDHLPIRWSVKAKSTSWRVAVEWREASTKDAGWREEDMEDEGSGGAAEGRERVREDAWAYIGRQRGGKTGSCYACERQP